MAERRNFSKREWPRSIMLCQWGGDVESVSNGPLLICVQTLFLSSRASFSSVDTQMLRQSEMLQKYFCTGVCKAETASRDQMP